MSDIYARSMQRYLLELVTNGRRRGDTLPEGQGYSIFATASNESLAAARDEFMGKWKDYLKGKTNHVLYIGEAPTVHTTHFGMTISARLLLSDKEVKS